MRILVPIDFTSITRTALNHAIQLGNILNADLTLLHIIKNEDKRDEATANFDRLLSELPAQNDLKTQITTGNIFSEINSEAERLGTQLIVMGTHGAKGLQKILGSHAMRVISQSKIPFIVTQEKEPETKVNEVVLPIDLTNESIQVVQFASVLAKTLDTRIHLVGEQQKDEWLANKVRNNLNISKTLLEKAKIKYHLQLLEGSDSFQKKVIRYGSECSANAFAVTYFSESILPQFDKFSQDIITNELEIPTLIVNAKQVSKVNAQFSFITI